MPSATEAVRELSACAPDALSAELLRSTQPLLLRGLVSGWPMAQAGMHSARAAMDYLRGGYQGEPVVAWFGAPEIDGRFFYNDEFSGFNFRVERQRLDQLLDRIEASASQATPEAIYMGSTTVDTCLPGFRAHNPVEFGGLDPLASIWVGNRTRIAAHHDVPDNLACVVAGRRRFTLFPPDQLSNLYIGPLDFTPAGQAISLVDFARPDLQRFPRFAQAMERAQVVELGPGDALFIPSMWWHHVEALDAFNVLINYWWRQSPAYMDSPMNALMLAIMTLRDLPAAERDAWQQMFQHYIFGADENTAAHVPKHARGVLSTMDADATRSLRARLLKRLNR
jgi:hypothetical protein